MACMDPRISFSNDFVAETQNQESNNYREAPVSGDFEFSVRKYNMIPADEIFLKGMLVPSKENCGNGNQMRKMTTLREELLADDDEDEYEDAWTRMQKSSRWWRERLGLKRGHNVTKKCDRSDGLMVMEDIVEEKKHVFDNEEGSVGNKTIQELLIEGGLN